LVKNATLRPEIRVNFMKCHKLISYQYVYLWYQYEEKPEVV